MLREATPEELIKWDQLVASNPDGGNVLQCRAFGEVKAGNGWEARYLMYGKVAILALVKKIPVLGEYWYIPKGPGVKDVVSLISLINDVRATKAFAIKLDPELPKNTQLEVRSLKLVKTRDIQYNTSTVIVDLRLSEEEIMASFKQKTRYNIRLSERKEVKVEIVDLTLESIDQMYQMAKSTYERAGVYVRDMQYFADFWKLHTGQGRGQMFFARHKGNLVAGAFVTHLGQKALYKDGASYREYSNLQAPYLLQWEIMKWLKQKGIEEYDLHGVPPKDQIDNSKHPLAGLARFKTGFNEEVVEYIGTYDYVLRGASYAVWLAIGERLAMAYESKVKKRLFY